MGLEITRVISCPAMNLLLSQAREIDSSESDSSSSDHTKPLTKKAKLDHPPPSPLLLKPLTTRAIPLAEAPSATAFLTAAKQLFVAVRDLAISNLLHGDISTSTVLLGEDGNLQLIDWDCDRSRSQSSRTLTDPFGDTMSISTLHGGLSGPYLSHDDLESAIYVIAKVLMITFDPPSSELREWRKVMGKFAWHTKKLDTQAIRILQGTLKYDREGLWNRPAYLVERTSDLLRRAEHDARASLLESLFELPIFSQRTTMIFTKLSREEELLNFLPIVAGATNLVEKINSPSFKWKKEKAG